MYTIKLLLCSNIRHVSGREFPVMPPSIHGLVDLISCVPSIGRPTSRPTVTRMRWRPPIWIWWPVTMNKNHLIQLLTKAATNYIQLNQMTSLWQLPCFQATPKISCKRLSSTTSGNSKRLRIIQRFQNSGILFYKNSCDYWFQHGADANVFFVFFFISINTLFSKIYCFQVAFKLLKTEIIFCIAVTYQCLYLHHHYWKRTFYDCPNKIHC